MIFREVWRVLRDDGVLWLNLGDSYTANRGYQVTDNKHRDVGNNHGSSVPDGLKRKDMIGIPWRVALALQADGWYLRSDIIWSKKNPMPESVTDRPTKAHEYIFLLSKSERYYYDHEAIKEPVAESSLARINQENFDNQTGGAKDYRNGINPNRSARQTVENFAKNPTGRNKRTVWTVSTRPYADAHFAVFPPDLIEPCILAGCPEQVCCECGAPWVRQVVKTDTPTESNRGSYFDRGKTGVNGNGRTQPGERYQNVSIGFAPTCDCNATTKPGLVFDPFLGSGTTAEVAIKCRRDWAGCELNPDYIDLIHKRLNGTQVRLFEA